MIRRIFSPALALFLVTAQTPALTTTTIRSTASQEPAAQQPLPLSAQESADEVVRITSNLVQLDLVVTDKSGKQVTDLKAEDFEVFEDGRQQAITVLSYISSGPSRSLLAEPGEARPVASTLTPLRRESVRRTIAVVVDDLGMSFETTVGARSALRRFVNEQIQPGDLVAIIRTGGGVGALQQFTNNKQQLLAAVERLRWNRCSRRGISAVEPVGQLSLTNGFSLCSQLQDSWLASIESLRNIVSGMRELPGRKSLLLFSDSFPADQQQKSSFGPEGLPIGQLPQGVSPPNMRSQNSDSSLPALRSNERIGNGEPLRNLAELAIRSSVVVYALDTRGLPALSLGAADKVGFTRQSDQVFNARIDDINDGRTGSALLAEQTGGLMIQNTNDLNLGLSRIMEDQQGYYLIGYRPGSETFNRRFHKIAARVRTRSNLSVRTRTGFFGVTDEKVRPAAPTAADRFQLALASPFAASEIDVRLTPVFTRLPEVGPVLRSLLHVDAHKLSFKEEPGGWRSAQLVLRALLFGDNGRIVDEHRRAFTVRLRGATFERVQSQGFDYIFNMPAKKPGSYQFRIALLDTSSSRVGSAGQFVEVPDLKKKRLALSGIVLNEGTPGGKLEPVSAASVVDTTEGPLREGNSTARRFRVNSSVNYDYLVFNAGGDPAGGRLTALVRLFYDGKLVVEHESPAEIMQQPDPSRVLIGGRLRLGTNLLPGEYVMQITVKDPSGKKGPGTATESAEFEIVQ